MVVKPVVAAVMKQGSILRQAIRARRARKRGEPVPAWTQPVGGVAVLKNLIMLEVFSKYRRIIGIVLLIMSAVVEGVLCNEGFLAALPDMVGRCSSTTKLLATIMGLFGGYAGVIGIVKAPVVATPAAAKE